MKKQIFTEPKINLKDKSGGYVWFRYDGQLFRYKYEINRFFKKPKDREREFKKLAKSLHDNLKAGWNPLVPDVTQNNGKKLTFYQALEFSLEKKTPNISDKTLSGYKGAVRYFKEGIRAVGLGVTPITEVKRVHIKTLMEWLRVRKEWSANNHNKQLTFLQALLSELIEWDVIEHNPAHNIKPMPVLTESQYREITEQEAATIREHLGNNHFGLYVFMLIIYHTGIRNVEITRLKCSDVDLISRTITLPARITKNKKARFVPINDYLYIMLCRYMQSTNPDYYLFGSFRQHGKGNVLRKMENPVYDDFIPAPTNLKRETPTKRWKKIVKDGLGININLYWMKRHGANQKILAGVPLDSLQELYGHHSPLITQIYATKVHEVNRKKIMELSPGF